MDTLYNWTGISAESNLKNLTYDIILDPYGYAIGVKLVEDPDQYVFLTGLDERFSNLGARNADANVIFTDGRMETVTVNLRNSRGLDNGRPDDKNTLLNGYNEWEYGQLNTWCTYTVDSNGVYTLRRVPTVDEDTAGKTYKAMQEAQDAAGADVEINKSHVALDGVGGGVANNAYSRVYGNDETIYINVDKVTDLTEIKDSNNALRTIIDDVDSVTVGVRNVDVVVEDLAASSWSNIFDDEIYTLHDDDGYIIAVITVGEDQGSTTNYAYITDNVRQETYGSDEDEWSWLLPAIVNGKAVDLREVGDALTELNGRTVGAWYEVRYDADGNVRRVNPITFVGTYNPLTNTKYLNNIDAVQDAIDGGTDDLLLSQNFRSTGRPYTDVVDLSFKGNTLFINTLGSATRGFSVSPDVNVVLCLADRNHNPFDDVDDSYTGAAGLQKALRNLDTTPTDSDGDGIEEYTLDGILSFVMEDGVITSIVLNDYTGPRANRFDAATPNFTISADPGLNVAENTNVVLTANVVAGNYGKLTYQWYQDTDKNTTDDWTAISGATSATYTVGVVTDSMSGNKYRCVVTNTDERSSITGDTVVPHAEQVTLTVVPSSMDVKIAYVDASTPSTKYFSSDITPFYPVSGRSYVIIAEEDAYVVDGNKLYQVTETVTEEFKANGYLNVDVPVVLVGVKESAINAQIPTELDVDWADADKVTVAGDTFIKDSATAVANLAEDVGTWGKTNNTEYTPANVSVNAATGKVDNLPDADNYGYFKVIWDGYTVTPTASYVKANSTTVVAEATSNWSSAGPDDIDVVVTAGTGEITLTKITPKGTSGADLEYTIGAITSDCTVNVSWGA